ncbi:fatty acid desaturase [Micromonospora sp. NPDC005710]|uniref:fatty acid desaturase family protein n=1 Tax=Micromonospora sp. NPDC005710 TaxID=3157051 RepID=UPI0033F09E68
MRVGGTQHTGTLDFLEARLRKFRAGELARRQRPARRRMLLDACSRVLPQIVGYAGCLVLPFPYNLLAVTLFALATVSLLGSWFHDSVHRSTCTPRLVAVVLQRLGSSPVGFSPTWWVYKHVRLHHRYPGDPELDPDIQFGSFGRVTPEQKWRVLHSSQHIHMWFLLPFATLNMLKPTEPWLNRRYAQRYGSRATTAGWQFLVDKYCPTIVVWAPVFLVRSFGSAISLFVTFHLVAGTLVSLITQVQHNTRLSVVDDNSWSGRWPLCNQLVRTSDVGTRRGLWWWLCGGVNFHVVHHLAPSLSFLELPSATRRLRAELNDVGLEVPTHKGMLAAIRSHASLIHALSRPERPSVSTPLATLGSEEYVPRFD